MGRRRRSKKLPTLPKLRANLEPEVNREITAIMLLVLALLLTFAMFDFGGFLVSAIFNGLKLAIGLSAYLVPFISVLLAWMLFQPEKYDVKVNNYIGFMGFILALSGLLHIGIDQSGAMAMAQAGNAGGFVGLIISRGLLTILNTVASTVILLALLAIFITIAANARLSNVWRKLWSLFGVRPKEDIRINEAVGMEVNTKLPIKGTIGGGRDKEDLEALTVGADPDWQPFSLDLLEVASSKADAGNIKENAATIQQTLGSFGIEVAMGEVNVGPTVTQYTLKPPSGVKLTKITGLDHNLALSLAAHPIRIEAPIPGKSAVGVEIPNKKAALVRLKDLLSSDEYKGSKSPLTFVLGRDVAGSPAMADLDQMPHLLIAGATGSGKSVMINALLTSLLYRNSPSDLKLILVDPKRVELSLYNDIPHLLSPVIVDPEKCVSALKWAVAEMERRYKVFQDEQKRNITEYNLAKKSDKEAMMPFIVVVIDELADLMAVAAQEVEAVIVRLAQMARATGIHLVLATQRPSVDVITGLIKANVPARIAFSVASQFDARTILDQAGAEKLLGKGDMLFTSPEIAKPKRIQGAYMSERETKAVTVDLKGKREPQYNDEVLTQPVRMGGAGRVGAASFDSPDDDMFDDAAETVIRSGKASASLLQRRLRVGYARAARLLDLLEERGVVGPADGARPRDVLVRELSEVSAGDDEE